MNRILIVGIGSIGLRHLKCLLEIGEKNIAAFRTCKGSLVFENNKFQDVLLFYDFNEALSWNPTHIIISNPTSLHLEFLSLSLETRAKIFVEKPVVHDYNELAKSSVILQKIILSNGFVGFNLRFHALFVEVKKVISENIYGKPLSSYLHVGHYLPFWHPHEDYRNSYVAKKELGGGSLRTLSHELDLTNYFFGHIKKVFAKVDKLSNLESNTDDTVDIILENEGCPRSVVHLDLLNPTIKRFGFIYFEKGLLEYDFILSKIEFTSYATKEKEIIFNAKEDYNLQYIRQMKNYLYGSNISACSLNDGIEVDKAILCCELSNNKGMEICLA